MCQNTEQFFRLTLSIEKIVRHQNAEQFLLLTLSIEKIVRHQKYLLIIIIARAKG